MLNAKILWKEDKGLPREGILLFLAELEGKLYLDYINVTRLRKTEKDTDEACLEELQFDLTFFGSDYMDTCAGMPKDHGKRLPKKWKEKLEEYLALQSL